MMQAMFPMEILETPGQITIIEEAFNQVRRIHLGAPGSCRETEPRFAGQSTGRWEGAVLVVDRRRQGLGALSECTAFDANAHHRAHPPRQRRAAREPVTVDDPEHA